MHERRFAGTALPERLDVEKTYPGSSPSLAAPAPFEKLVKELAGAYALSRRFDRPTHQGSTDP